MESESDIITSTKLSISFDEDLSEKKLGLCILLVKAISVSSFYNFTQKDYFFWSTTF